jgi:glycosyltransferase involved in cell wall biosynthesis
MNIIRGFLLKNNKPIISERISIYDSSEHSKEVSNPFISIILPIYNAQYYLNDAIYSIINQTFINFELLAINDGSTDSSIIILNSFQDKRIRILNNNSNLGLIYSLNRGIHEAKGQYIARMDADDIAHPKRLEKQLNYLYQHPDTIVVGTNMELIDESGKSIGLRKYPEHHSDIVATLINHCPFSHPSVMFKKSAVLEVGGYREAFKACEDYDLWLRLRDKGQFANIQENLLQYRIHSGQVTLRNIKLQHNSHMKARHEALGLADYSLLDKLKGKSGTLGSKYISIAYLLRPLNNNTISIKLSLFALFHSPLNLNTWKFLKNVIRSSKAYDLGKYYQTRISLVIFGPKNS